MADKDSDVVEKDRILEALADPEGITEALREGGRQAIRKHRQAGVPMVGYHDGEVVWVQPDDLPEE